MTRRTVLWSAAGLVVVAAAVVAGLLLFTGSDSTADPNQTAVTELCRDAAADYPGMSEGVEDFAVSELTSEDEGGATFYRATGTTSTSDGFGGESSYTFECKAKSAGEGSQLELLDITLL